MLVRRLIFAASLLAGLLGPMAAFGQAPPAVPALPDTERRTSYSITATKCVCSVGFAIYGDSTDVDEWIQVWVNGVRALSTDSTFGWSLSSATGPLLTIPRPITDAVLTFNSNQTATVQIVGARRPRQLTQFIENRGVPARDLNQRLTDITAIERELWDKTNDLTGRTLLTQPGNIMKPLPLPSACINNALGFGADGLTPTCLPFLITLPTIANSNVLGNFSGSAAVAAATPVPSCASDGIHSLTNNNGLGFNCTTFNAGTVTSVAAGCGTSTFGAAITTTGVIASVENYNPQAGTSYTVVNGDCGFLTKFTNNSAIAVTLPQANTPAGVNFVQGWYNDMCARGSGTATVTPQTSTINGVATLAITSGQCARIVSDGTNYQVVTLSSSSGGGVPGGATTNVQFNNAGAFGGDSGFTYAGSGGQITQSLNSAAGPTFRISGNAGNNFQFGIGTNNISSAASGQGGLLLNQSTNPFYVNNGGTLNQTLLFDPNNKRITVYNLLDNLGAPVNTEYGIFDWTTTTNVLTIGTQKSGTGSTRGVAIIEGGVSKADFGVTFPSEWSFFTTQVNGGFSSANPGAFSSTPDASISWNNTGQFIAATANGNFGFNGVSDGRTAADTGTSRAAAKVIAFGDGGSNTNGWLQWQGEARLDADFSKTSSTALANVTGTTHSLTVNLQASRNYIFDTQLFFVTGASAGGIQAAFGGTATVTNFIADGVCTDGTTAITVTRLSALATAFVANTNAGTTPKCDIHGTFEVNAAGTFTVQFAQNASSGTASTVKRGSFMKVHDAP